MTSVLERAHSLAGRIWVWAQVATAWTGRKLKALGGLFWRALKSPLPQIVFVLLLNKRVHKSHEAQIASAQATVNQARQPVNLDAAIALWQFETDRLNGLAAKGAAVLAADAIVATGLATQANSKGVPAYLCIAALVYLASAIISVFVVQRPMPRWVATPGDALNGEPANAMVTGVICNQRDGIKLQNLVYVGVRDTAISLALLLVALAYKLIC